MQDALDASSQSRLSSPQRLFCCPEDSWQPNIIIGRISCLLGAEEFRHYLDLQYTYLPQLCQELQVMAYLFLMTLHWPHIIPNADIQKAALQAALETLDSQHRSFCTSQATSLSPIWRFILHNTCLFSCLRHYNLVSSAGQLRKTND